MYLLVWALEYIIKFKMEGLPNLSNMFTAQLYSQV